MALDIDMELALALELEMELEPKLELVLETSALPFNKCAALAKLTTWRRFPMSNIQHRARLHFMFRPSSSPRPRSRSR